MASKQNKSFPEIGEKFTHRKLGSTWVVYAYAEFAHHQFFMKLEDKDEYMTVPIFAFNSIFKRFGEYEEKDLVPCL